MPWPLSQDYNEAVQNPASCFHDPQLQQAKVVCNAMGLPTPCSGNFADVYQLAGRGGTRWAVKCFTREIRDLQERYAAIGRHLHQAQLPFTVNFQYLAQGIRVRGQWYPALKMEWIEGLLLNDFIPMGLGRPALLDALFELWTRMARRLRKADIAHGDLQHGNVLLVPDQAGTSLTLTLIDYDGMWVPSLSGWPCGEVGHPNYQHPQRLREETYGPEVDRFAVLAVATALRCLRIGGRALWERYDNGDNLLFTARDFNQPEASPLFRELVQLDDPLARQMAQALRTAAQQPLTQTPLLEDLLAQHPAAVAVGGPAGERLPKARVVAEPAAQELCPAVPGPAEKPWWQSAAVQQTQRIAPLAQAEVRPPVAWREPGISGKPVLLVFGGMAAVTVLLAVLTLSLVRRSQPPTSRMPSPQQPTLQLPPPTLAPPEPPQPSRTAAPPTQPPFRRPAPTKPVPPSSEPKDESYREVQTFISETWRNLDPEGLQLHMNKARKMIRVCERLGYLRGLQELFEACEEHARRLENELSKPNPKLVYEDEKPARRIAEVSTDLRQLARDIQAHLHKQGLPVTMAAFDQLTAAVRKQLGNLQPGRHGDEAGAQVAVAPHRMKRMQRWWLQFDAKSGHEYLQQLADLGAILAIPVGEGDNGPELKIIRDLSRSPTPLLDEDWKKIRRIYWSDDNPGTVAEVVAALGLQLPSRPRYFVVFVPEVLEAELFKLEIDHAEGRAEDQILQTHFRVIRQGDRYRVVYHSIKFK